MDYSGKDAVARMQQNSSESWRIRRKGDYAKMMDTFEDLITEEWSSFIVTHPYMSGLPTFSTQPSTWTSSAKDFDVEYEIEVSGEWGGKWRVSVKDGKFEAKPEEGDFEGTKAVFSYDPSDFALSCFQRFNGGTSRRPGDDR